jgi:hypothetical protein
LLLGRFAPAKMLLLLICSLNRKLFTPVFVTSGLITFSLFKTPAKKSVKFFWLIGTEVCSLEPRGANFVDAKRLAEMFVESVNEAVGKALLSVSHPQNTLSMASS